MKLLYCEQCGDIFNLKVGKLKSCACGNVKGLYVDNWYAVTNGRGHAIAIGNGSFRQALYKKHYMEAEGKDYDRETYLNDCRVEYCWIRPNDGEGNPHSSVEEDMSKYEK
jgi:hypothetical protein